MAEHLIWKVTVRADHGPQLTASGDISVEAYDKLSVVVPTAGAVAVELGPANTGRITCLVILPSAPSKDVSYALDGKTVTLNQPQFLFGGAVDLVGNPNQLKFSNAGGADATVEILVGRDATPTI